MVGLSRGKVGAGGWGGVLSSGNMLELELPGLLGGLAMILREIVGNRMTSSSLSSAVATRAFPFLVLFLFLFLR